jgi:hypothetical protein
VVEKSIDIEISIVRVVQSKHGVNDKSLMITGGGINYA